MENSLPATPQPPPNPIPAQTTPPTPLTTPTPEKPKNKLVPFLVFLLLVVLGVAGYFGWQNYQLKIEREITDTQPEPSPVVKVDKTADWITYAFGEQRFQTNPIQILYPDSWFAENCGYNSLVILDPNSKPICETEPYNPIIVSLSPEVISEESLLNRGLPEFESSIIGRGDKPFPYTKYSIKKVQPAPGPEKYLQTRMPIAENSGTFVITINDLNYEKIADQILSTFKFIDEVGPVKCQPVTQPCNPLSCDYDKTACEQSKN